METSPQTSVRVEGGRVLVGSVEERVAAGGGASVVTSMERSEQGTRWLNPVVQSQSFVWVVYVVADVIKCQIKGAV